MVGTNVSGDSGEADRAIFDLLNIRVALSTLVSIKTVTICNGRTFFNLHLPVIAVYGSTTSRERSTLTAFAADACTVTESNLIQNLSSVTDF